MADPIVELIAEDIRKSLAQINGSGGYFSTAIVERFKGGGNEAGDVRIVVAQGNPSPINAENSYNLTEWIQPFEIEATVIDTEAVTGTPETRINKVWADIVRALHVDPTRGGLAVDTETDSPVFFADGVVVECNVQYRHVRGNPCQSA